MQMATKLLGTLLATLLLSEAARWLVVPLQDPYEALRRLNYYIRVEHYPAPPRRVVYEPGLPGLTGEATVTFTSHGTRGGHMASPKPAGEVRVFLVGGSVLECAVLDDADEVGRLLERRLSGHIPGARVYNAGRSGARSDDDVAIVSARLLHLEPDVLVFMAGVNDLRAAMEGHDYTHPVVGASLRLKPWRYALAQLQLGRLGWYLVQGRRPVLDSGQGVSVTPYSIAVARANAAPEAQRPPKTDVGAFRRNLESLIGMGQAHGVTVVLATQAATWSTTDPVLPAWHWMHNVGGERYAKDELAAALGQYNDVTRELAARHDLALYDAEAALPPTSDVFYDDVHFNRGGAKLAADGLARPIRAARGSEPSTEQEP